jgi:hypothetical protein
VSNFFLPCLEIHKIVNVFVNYKYFKLFQMLPPLHPPSNIIKMASGRYDEQVVDEKLVKREFDRKNRALRATEDILITLRAQFCELLMEITVQNDPLADARRFELLDMFEDFEIAVSRTDTVDFDFVLAAAKKIRARRRRVNLLAGLDDILNYNFLDKPAK